MNVNAIYYAIVLKNGGNPTAFFNAVDAMCTRLAIPTNAMLDCMYIETAGTFSPSKKNPGSTATGLIQFMESTARWLGTTTSALSKMSNVEQLVYVEKYFKSIIKSVGKTPKDFFDVYCCIFQPVWVGASDSAKLADSSYAANRGIDINKDAKITRGEFRNWALKQLPLKLTTQEVKKPSPI